MKTRRDSWWKGPMVPSRLHRCKEGKVVHQRKEEEGLAGSFSFLSPAADRERERIPLQPDEATHSHPLLHRLLLGKGNGRMPSLEGRE